MDAGLVWAIVGSLAGIAAVVVAVIQLRQSRRSLDTTPSARFQPMSGAAGRPMPRWWRRIQPWLERLWPRVEITKVSPGQGPVATSVMISGSGFGGAPGGRGKVAFGGLAADALSWSDTDLQVIPPPGLPPGPADVQIITARGWTATLPNAFERTT